MGLKKIILTFLALTFSLGITNWQSQEHKAYSQNNQNNNEFLGPTCYDVGPPMSPEPVLINRVDIQRQIQKLEKLYKDKKIGSETYQMRRKTLENQLKELK